MRDIPSSEIKIQTPDSKTNAEINAEIMAENDAKRNSYFKETLGEDRFRGTEQGGTVITEIMQQHLAAVAECIPEDLERTTVLWNQFLHTLAMSETNLYNRRIAFKEAEKENSGDGSLERQAVALQKTLKPYSVLLKAVHALIPINPGHEQPPEDAAKEVVDTLMKKYGKSNFC